MASTIFLLSLVMLQSIIMAMRADRRLPSTRSLMVSQELFVGVMLGLAVASRGPKALQTQH